jgi:hypothetical protein
MYGHVYIQLRPPQIVNNAQSSPLIHRYITDLSKTLEATTREELTSRLGNPRRPTSADSTAGVSMSGL